MNCKIGDLAYIVDSAFPENLGRVVEVIAAAFIDQLGQAWAVRARFPLHGVWPHTTRDVWSIEGDIHDYQLRPISGVPVDDETPVEIDVSEAVRLTLGPDVRLPVRWPE